MATPNLTATASGLAYQGRTTRRLAYRVAGGAEVARAAHTLAAAGLVIAIALGSLTVWTGVPLGGLWLASQLSDSLIALPVAPALAVAVGIPAGMVLGVRALASLERIRLRLTARTPRAGVVPGWRRSISDSSAPAQAGLLEKLMVANVLMAVGAVVIWFFTLAGSSLPA
jgi:hypothetical protein